MRDPADFFKGKMGERDYTGQEMARRALNFLGSGNSDEQVLTEGMSANSQGVEIEPETFWTDPATGKVYKRRDAAFYPGLSAGPVKHRQELVSPPQR